MRSLAETLLILCAFSVNMEIFAKFPPDKRSVSVTTTELNSDAVHSAWIEQTQRWPATIFGFLPSAFGVYQSVMDRLDEPEDKNQPTHIPKVLIAEFTALDLHLSGLQSGLKELKQKITDPSAAGFWAEVGNIEKCLAAFILFTKNTSIKQNVDDFQLSGLQLKYNLNHMMTSMLGHDEYGLDILTAIKDNVLGHPRQLRIFVNMLVVVLNAGVYLFAVFTQLNGSHVESLKFMRKFQDHYNKLRWRVDEEIYLCQNDRRRVPEEARKILKNTAKAYKNENKQPVAEAILRFLEEKYDASYWLVIVYSANWWDMTNLSGDFIAVRDPENGRNAAVLSVSKTIYARLPDQTRSLLYSYCVPRQHYKGFLYPIVDPHLIAMNIRQYFGYANSTALAVLPRRSWNRPFGSGSYATSASREMEFLVHSAQCGDTAQSTPVYVVPLMRHSFDYTCQAHSGHDGHLYALQNWKTRLYLAVEKDDKEAGLYTVMARSDQLRLLSSYWRFVDGQLRNDFGLCLTVTSRTTWYVYQDHCRPGHPGQLWWRTGSQIINGYSFCLAAQTDTANSYVIQDYCDNQPRFHWSAKRPGCW